MRPWLLLALLAFPTSQASAAICTDPLVTLFERVSPTVVSIQAMKINKAKPQRRFETVVGSGVIIERDGQVLTNAHVVDGAASLSVILDSKEKVPARVVGLDPVLDLALLRLETTAAMPMRSARPTASTMNTTIASFPLGPSWSLVVPGLSATRSRRQRSRKRIRG